MDGYMNVRQAAQDLQSGRVLAPGEIVAADALDLKDSDHDKALVADGLLVLVELPEPDPEPTRKELDERAKALNIEGRSKMSADELRTAIEEAEAVTASDDNTNGGE